MKPGIYTASDLSSKDYHAHTESISRSAIMLFDESPQKYWARYLNPDRPPEKVTPQMEFGTAFHSLILETSLFDKQYTIEPELLPSPKRIFLKDVGRPAYDAYKAEKAKIDFINEKSLEDFAEISTNTKILTRENWQILKEMRNAFIAHNEACSLAGNAIYEQSYFWIDEGSGLLVKSRPDILHNNMYVDLKTTGNASTKAYQREMIAGGYHIQAAMVREAVRVLEGRDLEAYINLCIETKYPYSIGIKIIGEKAMDEGERKYKEVLLNMKSALENNLFPSYEPETVELPSWYW